MDSTMLAKLRQYRNPLHCEFTQKVVFVQIPSEEEVTAATLLVGEAIAAPAGQPEPHVFWAMEEEERTVAYQCAFMAVRLAPPLD